MFLRQIFDPNLAQYSYLIGCQSTGDAIIFDPERDIDRYREIAEHEDLKITAVAETHIHADFVSGAREFAESDPEIRLYLSGEGGSDWQSEWAKDLPHVTLLQNGDVFRVGKIEFKALHTPGHTPEHMAFLVTDVGGGANEPMAMLSGDFLFVGDAGRPDLLEQAAGKKGAQEEGAKELYQSLRTLVGLPDYLQVLPAHGAGSSCGKALGSVPSSTLGYERKFNPALKLALDQSEKDFSDFILSGQPEPPAYFSEMKRVNRAGFQTLGDLPKPRRLSIEEVAPRLDDKAFVVLDTRPRTAFLAGHLQRSLWAPRAQFAGFAGSFLTPGDEIVLVVEEMDGTEGFVRQLIRMGFDRVTGVLLASDVQSAPAEMTASTPAVKFSEVPALLAGGDQWQLLDVRKAGEFSEGHLENAQNISHTRLRVRLAEVPREKKPLVSCASGARATAAAAFLARNGIEAVSVADQFANAPDELLNA
ncbi:MAG: rhodanese-like domain-containing protein [Chthoniobacterales bacterium]